MPISQQVARCWLAPIAVAVMVLSGCNEPFPASRSVGLAAEDGRLRLLAVLCADETVESVEVGLGDDQFTEARWRLVPVEPTSGEFTIDLSKPVGWRMDVGEAADLKKLRVPIAVRIQTSGGLVGTVLASMPEPGLVAVTGDSGVGGSSATISYEQFIDEGRDVCE